MNWATTDAESALHAADVVFRLGAPEWQVRTLTPEGRWQDQTSKVHHMLVSYVQPCYQDGRKLSPASFQDRKARLSRNRDSRPRNSG